MAEERLIGIAAILGLGVAAQWIAWRLRWPSILLLLLVGFAAGPIMRLVDVEFSISPDFIFGGLLFPLVSFAVAVILFEGGLTLRLDELPRAGGVMWRLVSVGMLATWIISVVAAHYVLAFQWPLAALLGAILVVTGPTVISPLLSHVRPQGTVGAILKWEGIVIDPIGATLTVLIFEAIVAGNGFDTPAFIVRGVLATLTSGVGAGLIGAMLLLFPMRRHWIPDDLQNGAALALVIATFVAANHVQHESGLLAVVVMGIALANQKSVPIRHIAEFKESLRVLLLSGLFIVLAARLSLSELLQNGIGGLMFLAVLVIVARPVSVLLATWRSRLKWNERLFLMWMAPRGIVAAAIASIFSLRLLERDYPGAEQLASLTVIIIVGTVTIYGLTATPVARKLKLTKPAPKGLLIAGAHEWARLIAKKLAELDRSVLLVDTRQDNIDAARSEGLQATSVSVQSQSAVEAADKSGLGTMISLTSNDEVNALACLRFQEVLGRANAYQLPPRESGHRQRQTVGEHQRGRLVFDARSTYQWLDEHFSKGGRVETIALEENEDYEKFLEENKLDGIPLFSLNENKELHVFAADDDHTLRAPLTLIAFVWPDVRDEKQKEKDKNAPAPEIAANSEKLPEPIHSPRS